MKKWYSCMVMAGVIFLGQNLMAEDLTGLIQQVKERYAQYQSEIKDMTMVQDMNVETPQGNMVSISTITKAQKKFRIVTEMQMPNAAPIKTVVVCNGTQTWISNPFMGKKQLSAQESAQYQLDMNWWELISKDGRLLGEEKVDTRNCYVVEWKNTTNGAVMKAWVDTKDLILIKGESEFEGSKKMEWRHSDFHVLGKNWQIPYKTQMYTDGKLVATSVIKSVEVNKGISESLFDPNSLEVPQQLSK